MIEDINFDMNTESKFELSHDDDQFQVSFYYYFTKRYRESATNTYRKRCESSGSFQVAGLS